MLFSHALQHLLVHRERNRSLQAGRELFEETVTGRRLVSDPRVQKVLPHRRLHGEGQLAQLHALVYVIQLLLEP